MQAGFLGAAVLQQHVHAVIILGSLWHSVSLQCAMAHMPCADRSVRKAERCLL